jgi:hypothetical protein
MADKVQPDAGDEREAPSSGLLISADPLQQPVNYELKGDDGDGDSDGSVLDNYVGQRPTVIEAGDDGGDSDGGDSDGDDSDADDSDGDDGGDAGDDGNDADADDTNDRDDS